MEFCRRWGIADAVHACPFPPDYPLDVAFVTSLSGYELGRMPRPPRMSEAPEPHSPMRLQVCSQMWFDPILQSFARTFPHVELALPDTARIIRGIETRRERRGRRSRQRPARAHRCRLSGRLRRREQHGAPLARYRAQWRDARTSGASVLPRARPAGQLRPQAHDVSSSPSIARASGRTFAIIDPANAMWRLMVLDSRR